MDTAAWRAPGPGVAESNLTEHTHREAAGGEAAECGVRYRGIPVTEGGDPRVSVWSGGRRWVRMGRQDQFPWQLGHWAQGEHPSWTDLGVPAAVWTGDGEVGRF